MTVTFMFAPVSHVIMWDLCHTPVGMVRPDEAQNTLTLVHRDTCCDSSFLMKCLNLNYINTFPAVTTLHLVGLRL